MAGEPLMPTRQCSLLQYYYMKLYPQILVKSNLPALQNQVSTASGIKVTADQLGRITMLHLSPDADIQDQ